VEGEVSLPGAYEWGERRHLRIRRSGGGFGGTLRCEGSAGRHDQSRKDGKRFGAAAERTGAMLFEKVAWRRRGLPER